MMTPQTEAELAALVRDAQGPLADPGQWNQKRDVAPGAGGANAEHDGR